MSAEILPTSRPALHRIRLGITAPAGLLRGVVLGYLSAVVLLPLAAIAWRSTGGGLADFWQSVSAPDAVAALQLTLLASLGVAAINAVMGTLIAWVLVREPFPGRQLLNAVIDLPFALHAKHTGVPALTSEMTPPKTTEASGTGNE